MYVSDSQAPRALEESLFSLLTCSDIDDNTFSSPAASTLDHHEGRISTQYRHYKVFCP